MLSRGSIVLLWKQFVIAAKVEHISEKEFYVKSWFHGNFFGAREILVFPHCVKSIYTMSMSHSVEKREVLSHQRYISANQLFRSLVTYLVNHYFDEIFAKNTWERISVISTLCVYNFLRILREIKINLVGTYFVKSIYTVIFCVLISRKFCNCEVGDSQCGNYGMLLPYSFPKISWK